VGRGQTLKKREPKATGINWSPDEPLCDRSSLIPHRSTDLQQQKPKTYES
jgi:hypothetical protein